MRNSKQKKSHSSNIQTILSEDSVLDESFIEEQNKELEQEKNFMLTTKVPKTFFFTQMNNIINEINKQETQLNSEQLRQLLVQNNFLPDGLMKQQFQMQKQIKKKIREILKEVFYKRFILIGVLKFVSVALLFGIPLVMNELTNQVRNFSEGIDYNDSEIIYISVVLLVVTISQAVIDTQYSYQINQLEMKSKVILYETLYHSSMSRKNVPKQNKKEGAKLSQCLENQQSTDLMTLFSIDVSTIINFYLSFHEFWSLILKLIIGLVLLYFQMKSAIFVGFGIALILMILNFWVALKIGDYYGRGLGYKDRRVELAREFVQFPKQIKYLKWETQWFKKTMESRIKEFEVIKKYKYLDSVCVLFWSITNTLISTATLIYFVTYSPKGEDIQNQNIFTMIYLFSLITNPLNSLPWTVSGMLQAGTSFERVDQYLLQPTEFNDFQDQITRQYVPNYQGNLAGEIYRFNDTQFTWKQTYFEQKKIEDPDRVKIYISETDTDQNDFVLRIDQLSIYKNKLYFVIGPTESGKSAFVSTLLKEMYLKQGQFDYNYNGNISYVPQSHWLEQSSIRNNITMQQDETDINYQNYGSFIQKSELLQDILKQTGDQFDRFEVGPEGSKLSGGQKQRLSLCRALYNDNDLYIFDDPFSSLDPNVSDAIFQKSILDYLKKLKNKTIIITLNDSYLSRYLDYADEIILIKDGVITTDEKQIQQYLNTSVQEVKSQINQMEYILCKDTEQEQVEEFLVKIKSYKEPEQQILQDNSQNTFVSVRFYLKNLGRFNFVSICISLVLMQVSFNFYDAWLNSYLERNPLIFIDQSFIITILTITGIDVLIKICRAFSFTYGNLKQAFKIFKVLQKKVLFGKAQFFDKEDSGQILTRLVSDQNVVDQLFPFELNMLLNNIVNFIGTFSLLIILKWQLIFPTLLSIIIFYKIQQQYRPTSLPLRRLEASTGANLMTQMNDQYRGIRIIVSFNKSKKYFEKFMNALMDNLRVSWTSKNIGLWLQIRLQGVATLIVFFVLLITNISINFKDSGINLPPSTLQLLLYYTLTKISLFRDLTLQLTTCERELISYERIRQYMNYQYENIEQNDQEIDQIVQQPEQEYFQDPILQFKDLTLDYSYQYEWNDEQNQQNEKLALKNISLSINRGQMVAFCGRTGSGKSSILSMIFQLYRQKNGYILLQGLQMCDILEWRKQISIIPQSGLVFSGTIKQNLSQNELSQQKLELLQKYIEQCPIKIDLDDKVEPEGKNLSQGIKQLLSFLRVLLEDQSIICLDEATASVDQKLEDWILQTLIDLSRNQNKTVIFISHRLEALKDFDRIFYMENGTVEESGTFNEMCQNPQSKFNKLRSLVAEEQQK